MKKKTVIAVSWILVLACMGIIFYFSAQNGDESQALSDRIIFIFGIPVRDTVVRKAAHFTEFAGLALLVFNALKQTLGRCCPYLSFFVAAVYAVSDEFHQFFVPGRAAMLIDILIDSLGAATAIVFLMLIIKFLKKRRTV